MSDATVDLSLEERIAAAFSSEISLDDLADLRSPLGQRELCGRLGDEADQAAW